MPAKKAPKVRKQKEVLELAPPKSEIRFKQRRFQFSEKQKNFLTQILDPRNKIIFIKGSAGTSKSYLAIYAALHLLKENEEISLLFLRSIVESASHSIGFLKGTEDEKVAPYLEILNEKLEEMLVPSDRIALQKSGRVEGGPINFIRGRSFENKVIVMDEAQNLNDNELLTLMTRLAFGSKLILMADVNQSDIKHSGYQKLWDKFSDEESRKHGIIQLEFTSDDCVRSEIVKFILKKFGL